MGRINEDGTETVQAMCPCCSHAFVVRLGTDAHGAEKTTRGEIAVLRALLDRIAEEFGGYKARRDIAWKGSAREFAKMAREVMSRDPATLRTFDDMSRDLKGAARRIDGLDGGGSPGDLAEIEGLRARARVLAELMEPYRPLDDRPYRPPRKPPGWKSATGGLHGGRRGRQGAGGRTEQSAAGGAGRPRRKGSPKKPPRHGRKRAA